MSIRSDAKQLGISDSYLCRLLSGKRRWTPELYEKYLQLQLSQSLPQIGNFGSTNYGDLATKYRNITCLGSKHSTTELRPHRTHFTTWVATPQDVNR